MADIKQAAKWMEEGKQVSRKSEPLEVFHASAFFDGTVMMSRCGGIPSFARMTVKQIRGTDWQLAD